MEFNLLLADQIGAHLKSLRKLRGLSQAQLGQRLGVGQARVAAIEADPGAVSVEQLLRVFQVLGVDLVARVKSDPVKLTQAQPVSRQSSNVGVFGNAFPSPQPLSPKGRGAL